MTVNCSKSIYTRNNGLLPSPPPLRFTSSIKNNLLMLLLGREDCQWSLCTTTQWLFRVGGLTEHLSCSPHSSRVTKCPSVSGDKLKSFNKRPNISSTVSQKTITSTPATSIYQINLLEDSEKVARGRWKANQDFARLTSGKRFRCDPNLAINSTVRLWERCTTNHLTI